MSLPTPTEVLFFLWCDYRVTFDLPPEIVSLDPVTYTIEWLGEDHFVHSWAAPGKPATPPESHSMESTMRFIEKNAKYFNDPLESIDNGPWLEPSDKNKKSCGPSKTLS